MSRSQNIKQVYPSREALPITGITVQKAQHWIAKGLITPLDLGGGTGTTRQYSLENLLEIHVAQALSGVLFHVGFVRQVMNQIRDKHPDFFKKASREPIEENVLTIYVQSKNAIAIFIQTEEDHVECAREGRSKFGFGVLSFDLVKLKEELFAKIELFDG